MGWLLADRLDGAMENTQTVFIPGVYLRDATCVYSFIPGGQLAPRNGPCILGLPG